MASRLGRFVSELKRRHVWQVVLAYAAVVFVLLQLGEIVFPAFGAPAWALRILVISAFIGFPVAVVLAWVFELTPQGVQKTLPVSDDTEPVGSDGSFLPLPHLALIVVTIVTAGGLGWWAFRDSLSEEVAAQGGGAGPTVPVVAAEDDIPVIRSLAVLPLDDFSEEEGGQYFAAGMHEELVSQLSQLATVRVLSRTSLVQFDRTGKTMPQIASELGVEGVVEGSVFRAGDRVRITVQLIHGPQDRHLWANSYEGTTEDAIALQREVAQAIAREIKAELAPNEEPEPEPTRVAANPTAQDEYLKGRYEQAKATPEALEAALRHYQESVQADSTFAPAYAGLAASRFLLGLNRADSTGPASPEEMGVTGPLEKAFVLDEDSPEARAVMLTLHEALGSLPEMSLPEGVEIMFDSAVSIGSELSVAGTEFGRQLQRIVVEQAPRISTGQSTDRRLAGARRLQAAGDYQRAESVLRELIASTPQLTEAWEALEYLKTQQKDFEGAVEVRKARLGTFGIGAEGVADVTETEESAAVAELENRVEEEGAKAYWSWKLEELEAVKAAGKRVSGVEQARALVGLGDYDAALTHLHEAFEARDRNLLSLFTDPAWDPLRTDPQFRHILNRLRHTRGKPGVFFPDWP